MLAIATKKMAAVLNKELPGRVSCFDHASAETRPASFWDRDAILDRNGEDVVRIVKIFYKADCFAFPREIGDAEIRNAARRAGGNYENFLDEIAEEIEI